MAEPKEITVSWPPLALGTAGWIERLNDLASDAERLVGLKVVTLQRTAELGLAMVGLLWPGFSPETVAASCRASALLGVPVVMSTAPADQCAEIAERLDAIYAAAQADPAAGLVEVPAPLLQQVRPPDPRLGRKRQRPEPEPEPEDRPAEPEQITQAVLVDDPVEPPAPEPAPSEDPDDLPAAWRDCATPAPAPAPEPPAPPTPAAEVPADWLLAADVAELLNISVVTVSRWRLDGHLGAEGQAWLPSGRSYAFEPNQIELLMDHLAAKKKASTERTTRARVGDQRPPGWLTCDEFARAAGCSGRKARDQVLSRLGDLAAKQQAIDHQVQQQAGALLAQQAEIAAELALLEQVLP
jgi:hypothetical protein